MLYKLIAAAAIVGLSAAAPAETAATAMTPPTAEEAERIDGIMLRSLISSLQQKVNRFETLALKEGMKFDTAAVALRDHNSDDPTEKCMNAAKIGYFKCLDDHCLTTQCEQKTPGMEPFNGRKEWDNKKYPPSKENQALEALVDTLSAQANTYEEMLLTRTPQQSVALSERPEDKAYYKNWGREEAMCISTYNDAVAGCK